MDANEREAMLELINLVKLEYPDRDPYPTIRGLRGRSHSERLAFYVKDREAKIERNKKFVEERDDETKAMFKKWYDEWKATGSRIWEGVGKDMEIGYDSGTGSESERESAEERRVRAMRPKKIEEKHAEQVVAHQVEDATELMRQMAIGKGGIDRSDIFSRELRGVSHVRLENSSTGMSQHFQYGEKHKKATLTDELAQKIRKEYWAGGGAKKGGKKREGSATSLAEKYGVGLGAIKFLISRKTWVHLPQVEGEPDENMERLSINEKIVERRAKELGVEPVRNKIGRLALPEEVVVKLREEATSRREAIKKANREKKKAEKE